MIIVFIVLNLLIVFSSYLAAYQWCRDSFFSNQIISTFLFYIFQITVSILFLGSVIKKLTPLSLFLFNFILAGVVIVYLRRDINPAISHIKKGFSVFFTSLYLAKDYFLYILFFLFLLQVIGFIIKIYYLPPFVGDVFSYHLHPVIDWFQQGRILSYTDTPVWRAYENPLGAKPFHFWFLIFWGDLTWIETPQFLFGLMLIVAAYNLMRKANIPVNRALKYGILIYFLPSVLLQSRTCQDHLILAACTLFTVIYSLDVFYRKQYRQSFTFFISLGFLFSIKRHSVVVIAVLLVLILFKLVFNRRDYREFFKHSPFHLLMGFVLSMSFTGYYIITKKTLFLDLYDRFGGGFIFYTLLPMGGVVFLLVMLRLIKKKYNLKISFNFHPRYIIVIFGFIVICATVLFIRNYQFLKPFLGGPHIPLMSTNKQFNSEYPNISNNFIKNLLVFPFRLKDTGQYTSYTPDLQDQSGFGFQFFVFGLIGYGYAGFLWVFKKSFRTSIMGFLLLFSVLLLAVYFAIYFSWANYRSFIFFAIIGIIFWSYLLGQVNLKKYHLVLVDSIIILMVLFNGVNCFFEGNLSPRRWKTLFTVETPVDRTSIKYSSLFRFSRDLDSWDYIDRFLTAEQPLGYSASSAAWIFPYFDNQAKRHIYFLETLPGYSLTLCKNKNTTFYKLDFTPDFKASLIARGIHFLHINYHGIPRHKKIIIQENEKDLYKVTSSLFYFNYAGNPQK